VLELSAVQSLGMIANLMLLPPYHYIMLWTPQWQFRQLQCQWQLQLMLEIQLFMAVDANYIGHTMVIHSPVVVGQLTITSLGVLLVMYALMVFIQSQIPQKFGTIAPLG
jgi:hypothetical protein